MGRDYRKSLRLLGRNGVVFSQVGPLRISLLNAVSDNPYKYMCQGLNSHYFHIIGDGHQPNNRGLYTNYKDSY